MKDKVVYWDEEKQAFYWIEWIETGNNDIPLKHYIQLPNYPLIDNSLDDTDNTEVKK